MRDCCCDGGNNWLKVGKFQSPITSCAVEIERLELSYKLVSYLSLIQILSLVHQPPRRRREGDDDDCDPRYA